MYRTRFKICCNIYALVLEYCDEGSSSKEKKKERNTYVLQSNARVRSCLYGPNFEMCIIVWANAYKLLSLQFLNVDVYDSTNIIE